MLGTWNLELGTWNLELGTWNLELENEMQSRCRMIRLGIIVLVVIVLMASARAAEDRSTYWLGYMADIAIAPYQSIWFDTHYNAAAFFVLRGGLTQGFNAGPRVTAGYAFLLTDPGSGALERKEHRPWAQVFVPVKLSDTWRFSQRIRYDHRIQQNIAGGEVVDGWSTNNRLRFQSVFSYYLSECSIGQPLLQLADEVLFDLGPDAGPNYLDQNRLSFLVGLQTGSLTFRAGYMWRFIPGRTGNNITNEHALILWVNHSLDLRRPEDTQGEQWGPEVGNP